MSSTYCTQENIEAVFGTGNVAAWLDMDNDGTADTGRAAWAIDLASDEIDDTLRGTHYTIPLATPGAAVPNTIRQIAAMLAGVWLYESRGAKDYNPQTGQRGHRYTAIRDTAKGQLEEIRQQRMILDAVS